MNKYYPFGRSNTAKGWWVGEQCADHEQASVSAMIPLIEVHSLEDLMHTCARETKTARGKTSWSLWIGESGEGRSVQFRRHAWPASTAC
jgi:hypothetical protein